MSFDVKCLHLAETFAKDWDQCHSDEAGADKRRKLINELAQRIQDTIEEFEEAEVNK